MLERRPDVAEAERQLAAANARIGVAKAAFFPVLRLTGSGGFVSADVESLFNWESRVWSIGPSLSLPIFAGGRNRANLQRSRAAYEESVARYRQRVLVAFGEVENSLASIRYLGEQATAQERAVASARHSAQLASDRYDAGIVSTSKSWTPIAPRFKPNVRWSNSPASVSSPRRNSLRPSAADGPSRCFRLGRD